MWGIVYVTLLIAHALAIVDGPSPRVNLSLPLETILKSGVKENVFTDAVVYGATQIGTSNVRYFETSVGKEAITLGSKTARFDLASLTKPLGTALALQRLLQNHQISPGTKAMPFIEGFGKKSNLSPIFGAPLSANAQITIQDLLLHESGMPVILTEDQRSQIHSYDTLLGVIADMETQTPKQSPFRYSDLGYMWLGQIVQSITNVKLDDYLQQNVYSPSDVKHLNYQPYRLVQVRSDGGARPHDPNAAKFYPVQMGHAGLFGSALDIFNLLKKLYFDCVLNSGRPENLWNRSSCNQLMKPGGRARQRAYGFDLTSPYSEKIRGPFPDGTLTHSGYTGVSFLLDPSSGTILVFLSNRGLLDNADTRKKIGEIRLSLANRLWQLMHPKWVPHEETARLNPHVKKTKGSRL